MTSLPPVDPTAPRIFIDTSVIYAGVASRTGASHALLVLAELGLVRPVVCPYVLDEAKRNILKKAPEAELRYREAMANINWEIFPDPPPDAVKQWLHLIVSKDAPVLAAGVIAKPHRLVTLDAKDFLNSPDIVLHSGLKIITPGDLLREIRDILAKGFGTQDA